MIAKTPKPPYYAVIFTSVLKTEDQEYIDTAIRMEELAKNQKGFLGIESARNEIGISVSYWESLEAITEWKNNAEHKIAQEKGIKEWYKNYHLRIAKVERDYSF